MSLSFDLDQNEIVRDTLVEIDLSANGYTELYDRHLEFYGLHEVFTKYGPPDAIYFKNYYERLYDIDIVYEKLKMVIIMPGKFFPNGDSQLKVCPNIGDGQISAITIALAAPSFSGDIKNLIEYPFTNDPNLEDETGLTISSVYNLFTSDLQPACFIVN
jgi:hypothetical protein